MNGSNKLLAVGLMAGLLVCGGFLGVAVDRYLLSRSACPKAGTEKQGRPGRRTRAQKVERLTKLFTKRLDLTAEQQKVVRKSLEQSFDEMKPIRLRIQPELKAVRERAREKIRKVLTAPQRDKYNQMVRRYEARRAKRFR
jgi:hypothetical protein